MVSCRWLFVVLAAILISQCLAVIKPYLDPPLDRFNWLVGRWHSEAAGTVHWPTIPTMSFSETLDFWPAEISRQSKNMYYINYTAVATSHNSGDHFHNEYGYLTVTPSGFVKMFAIGNNGFATVEKGIIDYGLLILESTDVDRIVVARELPTEQIKREFRLNGEDLELTLSMRTVTHPAKFDKNCEKYKTCPLREHAFNRYKKVLSLEDLAKAQRENKLLDGDYRHGK